MGPKRVLIFGLSANPPTDVRGHFGIVQHFAPLYDEIWIMPVFKHIFVSKSGLISYEHRINMCNLGKASLSLEMQAKVKVIQAEKETYESILRDLHSQFPDTPQEKLVHQIGRVGTYDVLRYLRSQEGCCEEKLHLHLLQGGDTFQDFCMGKWKHAERILDIVQRLIVVHRKGVEPGEIETFLAQSSSSLDCKALKHKSEVHFIDGLGDVSSTKAREKTTRDELLQYVHADVASYIVNNNLYSFETS